MVAQLYERACPSLLYTSPHCAAWPPTKRAGKIKIGFISKFLKNHSVGKAARGVLANLSRDQFSVTALLVPPVADDEISRFVQQKADKTVVLPGSLKGAREAIAAEELDILFYQDIGMDPFTYFLAFARLAPVQCLFFGHSDTSGIRNLDYFISSEHLEMRNAEEHYSERLIRLKSCVTYYYKPKVPAVLKSRSAFGFDDADHVYLCPQTLYKFHPDLDGLFAGILKADPRARIVLKGGKERHWTDLLLNRFRRTMGHVMSRITVLPQQPAGDFIRLIAASDVMLDTRPYSGYTTSLEAFAVGTPVVTWPGEFQRGRLTLSLYKDMGILDCVAEGPGEYVDIAVRLGTDKAYRDKIKDKILKKNHCLYEDPRAVKEYERAFLRMVKEARAAKPDRAAPGKRR
jgi:predicted O-linked N-acetylglucosamine transferase (SPINDLY family)